MTIVITRLLARFRRSAPDRWYEGYNAGFFAGRRNMEAKWRGNVYGTGPYAGYPVPARDAENAPDALGAPHE